MTNYLAEAIVRRLLERAFGEELEQLNAKLRDLGDRIYEEVFTTEERALFEKLPCGWLPTTDVIKIGLSDTSVHVSGIKMSRERPVPYSRYHQTLRVYDAGSHVYKTHEKLDARIEQIKKERRETERQVLAVVHSVSTLRKLTEVWPEITPLVADLEHRPPPPKKLPVVRTEELNRVFRLPPEAAGAGAS